MSEQLAERQTPDDAPGHVTIATYAFPLDAHIARTRLEAEGIEDVVIADEHTVSIQWLYCNAVGGIKLQVPAACAEEAISILQIVEDGVVRLVGGDEVACSQCGSTETEYYPYGKKWALASFAVLGFPFYPVTDGVRCRACGTICKAKP